MCDCNCDEARDEAERASYWRNRDEIVGYPAYSGGPTND